MSTLHLVRVDRLRSSALVLALAAVFEATSSPALALSYTLLFPHDESGTIEDSAYHFDEYFVRYDPASGWSSTLYQGNNTPPIQFEAVVSPDSWPGLARANVTLDYFLTTEVYQAFYEPDNPFSVVIGAPEEYFNFAGVGSLMIHGGIGVSAFPHDAFEPIIYGPSATGGSVTFSFLLSEPGSYLFFIAPDHLVISPASAEVHDPALPAAAIVYSRMGIKFSSFSLVPVATPVADEQRSGLLLAGALLGLSAVSLARRSRPA